MPIQDIGERLAILEVRLKNIDHDLFGNGQPGMMRDLDNRIKSLEKRWWIAIGVLVVFQLLTSNGVISLKSVLGMK
jgi:hypothetical protein